VSGQLHAPAALPLRKSPRYPFYGTLGGPQSLSERYGEVNIFYPIGTRTPAPPGRPAHSQSLYRLSYVVLFNLKFIISKFTWIVDLFLGLHRCSFDTKSDVLSIVRICVLWLSESGVGPTFVTGPGSISPIPRPAYTYFHINLSDRPHNLKSSVPSPCSQLLKHCEFSTQNFYESLCSTSVQTYTRIVPVVT
jgi:hypothetical protein